MSAYTDNLKLVTGVLTIKMMAMHVLTIRARVGSQDYKTSEDALFGFLTPLMRAGPGIPLERLLGIVRNSIENEPFFLLVAFALQLFSTPPQAYATYLQAYAATRCLHAVSYLLKLQPFRGIFFGAGAVLTIMFGIKLLQ
ncbi:hypothetical protein DIPPA_12342 [Diplonema papillatum]|nr:hypothetical protein DIPPA_12342 [Diplonema papillatum]